MKLTNVSMAARAVNQNLKNQKTAPKNPSFGSTLEYQSDVLSESYPVSQKEVRNLKTISNIIGKNYLGYKHTLSTGVDDELMLDNKFYVRENFGMEIRQSELKEDEYIKPISAFIQKIDKQNFLKQFDVSKFNDVKSMEARLERGLQYAANMNVPEDVIEEYRTLSNAAIDSKK